jgi:hypothetical protein
MKYLKYAGKEHWSKVDEELLEKIAVATDGQYIAAGTSVYDLGEVYENHLADLAHGEFRSDQRRRYHERYQWFLCAGLIALAVGVMVPAYPRRQNGATPTQLADRATVRRSVTAPRARELSRSEQQLGG